MAATFSWNESNTAGQTVSSGVANCNWKNTDDTATAYTASPIVAGNNSYTKWQWGAFTGSWNQLLNGLFGHTAGDFGTGITLICQPTMTQDSDKLTYATPSTADASATLTRNITLAQPIASGVAMWFGPWYPGTGTKTASYSNPGNGTPACTNFMGTQLKTTGSASAGDTATATLTLQYDEN